MVRVRSALDHAAARADTTGGVSNQTSPTAHRQAEQQEAQASHARFWSNGTRYARVTRRSAPTERIPSVARLGRRMEGTMKNQICSLVGVLGLLGGPMTAAAKTIIAFEFVGQVTSVSGAYSPAIEDQFGDGIFSGIFRFDAELQDQDPFSDHDGEYGPLGFGHVTFKPERPDVPNYLAVLRNRHGNIYVRDDRRHL